MVSASAEPANAHQLLVFLVQLGLLLVLALALGKLARRCGLPPVVGELTVGVLVGPSVLGRFAPGMFGPAANTEWLDGVSQLGVLLLVGVAGTDVDLAQVRRQGGVALRMGSAGLVLPLGLGVAAGLLMPAAFLPPGTDPVVFALFLGVAMGVSAIPVIAKIFMDMDLLHRDVGQLTMAVGVLDDVAGWLMLSVVGAMATSGLRGGDVAWAVLSVALTVLGALLVGRPLTNWLLGRTTRSAEIGPTVTAVTAIVLLCAAATQALGLEPVLGALAGGLLVASCPEVRPAHLAPLRTMVLAVFAPLFFATVGLRLELGVLVQPALLVTGLVLLLVAVVGKFAGAAVGALGCPLNKWEVLAVGAGMNARGVIQIVVAMVGLRLGVLTQEIYTIIILVAVATSLMAPPVLAFAMRRVDITEEELARARQRRGG